MTIIERKERAKIILNTQQTIFDKICASKSTYVIKQIKNIAVRNQQLLNCNTPTFLYKSIRYSADDTNRQPKENHQLHHTLREEVMALVDDGSFETLCNMAILEDYLVYVFQVSNTIQDLLGILPDSLHSIIREIPRDNYDIPPALSPDAVMAFNTEHVKGTDLIKQYMAYNLIYHTE